MPIPKDSFAPFKGDLLDLVNHGWDTNRERDAIDGHDRLASADKLRTAMLAFACQTTAATGEALAMLVEIEQQLRRNSTRSPTVIKEMMAILRRACEGAKSVHSVHLLCGAMAALLWTLGAYSSHQLEQVCQGIVSDILDAPDDQD